MPDMNDDPTSGAGMTYEIVHSLNTGTWHVRRVGDPNPILEADTASAAYDAADQAGIADRLWNVGGGYVSPEHAREAATNIDRRMGSDLPEQYPPHPVDDPALADFAAILREEATAAPEAALGAGEPGIGGYLDHDAMDAASREWLSAYQARDQVMKKIDEHMAAGGGYGDDEMVEYLRQWRISDEAMRAADAKEAALGEAALARFEEAKGPEAGEDPPEATAQADPVRPRPGGGAPEAVELEVPDASPDASPDAGAEIPPGPFETTGTDPAQERRELDHDRDMRHRAGIDLPTDLTPDQVQFYAEVGDRVRLTTPLLPGEGMWKYSYDRQLARGAEIGHENANAEAVAHYVAKTGNPAPRLAGPMSGPRAQKHAAKTLTLPRR